MPSVPRISPTVQPAALPNYRQNINAPASAFQGVNAEALGQIGGTLQSAGEELQKRQDDVLVREAYRKASDEARTFLREEAYPKQGRDALGVTALADKRFAEIAAKNSKGLTGNQLRVFQNFWDQLRDGNLNGLSRYEQNQTEAALQTENEAILKGTLDDALMARNDDQALSQAMERGAATIRSMKGLPLDAQNQKLREHQSLLLTGVIDSLLADGNVERARKVFDDPLNKDTFTARNRLAIQDNIVKKETRLVAQKASDAAIAEFGDLGEAEAAKKVKATLSGDQRDLAMQYLEAGYADIRRMHVEQVKKESGELMVKAVGAKSFREALAIAQEAKDPETFLKVRDAAFSLLREQDYLESRAFTQGQRVRTLRRQALEDQTTKLGPEAKAQQSFIRDFNAATLGTEIRRRIDQGEFKSEGEALVGLANLAQEKKIPFDQISGEVRKEIGNYFAKGGLSGEVSQSRVESMVKRISGDDFGLDHFPELYSRVVQNLPRDGSRITDDTLMKSIQPLLLTGYQERAYWFDRKTPLLEHLNQGKPVSEWIAPDPVKNLAAGILGFLKKADKDRFGSLQIDDPTISNFYVNDVAGIGGKPNAAMGRFWDWLNLNHPEAAQRELSPEEMGALFEKFSGKPVTMPALPAPAQKPKPPTAAPGIPVPAGKTRPQPAK